MAGEIKNPTDMPFAQDKLQFKIPPVRDMSWGNKRGPPSPVTNAPAAEQGVVQGIQRLWRAAGNSTETVTNVTCSQTAARCKALLPNMSLCLRGEKLPFPPDAPHTLCTHLTLTHWRKHARPAYRGAWLH